MAPLRPGTQAGIVAVILGGLALGFVLHPVTRFGDTSLALFGLPLPQICWFRLTTGLPCASCGVTRAVVLLLHGRLQDSWAAHPFGVPVLALILAALPPRVAGALGRRRLWVPRWDRAWGWAVAGTLLAMLLWWLAMGPKSASEFDPERPPLRAAGSTSRGREQRGARRRGDFSPRNAEACRAGRIRMRISNSAY
jgi:hypothetical protein